MSPTTHYNNISIKRNNFIFKVKFQEQPVCANFELFCEGLKNSLPSLAIPTKRHEFFYNYM